MVCVACCSRGVSRVVCSAILALSLACDEAPGDPDADMPMDGGADVGDVSVDGDADASDGLDELPHPGACGGDAVELGDESAFELTFDTREDTDDAQPTEECRGARTRSPDRVFRYVPPRDGLLYASTDYRGTEIDTLLYARTACDGAGGEELVCDDDFGQYRHRAATIMLPVAAGVPVFVIVDGALDGDAGPVELVIELLDPAMPIDGGDSCADAPELTWSRGTHVDVLLIEGDTSTASSTSSCIGEEGDFGTPSAPDHHYRITLDEPRLFRAWMTAEMGRAPIFWLEEECGIPVSPCETVGRTGGTYLLGALNVGTKIVVIDGYEDPELDSAGPYRLFLATRPI